jgi:hypothetical protein
MRAAAGSRTIEECVRQYRYEATEETVEALRALRGAWAGILVERSGVTVRLADAREVRLAVERADPEQGFEAFRISAAIGSHEPEPAGQRPRERPPFRDTPDFAVGRNDVVLFAGATWIEEDTAREGGDETSTNKSSVARDQVFQLSGHPGQVSETAAAVCLTTDAVVVATPVGTGFLIRTGLQPNALEVTDDPGALDQFLRERGYGSSGSGD